MSEEERIEPVEDNIEEQTPAAAGVTAAPAPAPASRRSLATLLDYLEIISVAIGIVLLIFLFVGRLAVVQGESMRETLQNQDKVLVTNLFYKPHRGDIVVITNVNDKYPELNEALVKRVIGLPGDTIDIDYTTGTVYVNGEAVTVMDKFPDGSDSYVYLSSGYMQKRGDMPLPVTVPEGHVFVMGDNRNNSLDSRYTRIGFVDVRSILGHVILRLAPFGPVS